MDAVVTCPQCGHPSRAQVAQPGLWQCPECEHRLELAAADKSLATCPVCGNHELYKQKDFPHTLGMVILAVGCIGSLILFGVYHQWVAWTVLIASALLDVGLYNLVGDAIVCYRCLSVFRGFTASGNHHPFELTIGERYRQERLRKARLR